MFSPFYHQLGEFPITLQDPSKSSFLSVSCPVLLPHQFSHRRGSRALLWFSIALNPLLHADPYYLSPVLTPVGPHLKGHFLVLKWRYYPIGQTGIRSSLCNSRNSVFTIQGPSFWYSDFIACTSVSSFFCPCWWQHNSVQPWKAVGAVLHVLPSDDKCILLAPWTKCLLQSTIVCERFLLQNSSCGYRLRDLWTESTSCVFASTLLERSLFHGCSLGCHC